MDIHLAAEIETNQGTFQRVNTRPYKVAVSGGVWSPDAGVLLYPDRRARRMKVYAPVGQKASGEINIISVPAVAGYPETGPIVVQNAATGDSGICGVDTMDLCYVKWEDTEYCFNINSLIGDTKRNVASRIADHITSSVPGLTATEPVESDTSTNWEFRVKSETAGPEDEGKFLIIFIAAVVEQGSGPIIAGGGGEVLFPLILNNGVLTVSIDTQVLTKDIPIEIPFGQTPGQVEAIIVDGLNGDGDFSEHYVAYDNSPIFIEANGPGPDYGGTITIDYSSTGIEGTNTDLIYEVSDEFQLVKSFDLSASKRSNYAFALVDNIDLTTFESGEVLDLEGYNDANEVFDNRVKVSETNQPFLFEADKTYYPGKGSGDRVVAFAVNALPVSQGQFGQYPLYVLCSQSIWGLEQSADPLVAFGRVSPVSMTHGLDHRRGVVNIGRQIIFMYQKRLYPLDGSADPEDISKPVAGLLDGAEPLAYYSHDDVSELWIATDNGILAYSLEYGRWFSLDRDVHFFMRRGNELYGVEAGGDIRDEYALSGANVDVSFTLDPVHFGFPDSLKRIYALYVRAALAGDPAPELTLSMEGSNTSFLANKLFFRPRHRSAYSFVLQVEGVMDPGADHWIHRIDAELDLRYRSRTRPTKL